MDVASTLKNIREALREYPNIHDVSGDGWPIWFGRIGVYPIELQPITLPDMDNLVVVTARCDFVWRVPMSEALVVKVNDLNVDYPNSTFGVYQDIHAEGLFQVRCAGRAFGSMLESGDLKDAIEAAHQPASVEVSKGFLDRFGGVIGTEALGEVVAFDPM